MPRADLKVGGSSSANGNAHLLWATLLNFKSLMSAAINIFFRQAIREQCIPFELKPYDDYYSGDNLTRLHRSIEQAERGETISFSLAELEAMETGEIPQRAIDFLVQHKEVKNANN